MNSKLIFVSMPMGGRSGYEIETEFLRVHDHLYSVLDEPFTILDSYFTEEPDDGVKNAGAWYLGASIRALSYADIVYFVKGWQDAKGCRLEHQIAESYGITIIEE